MRRLLFGLLLVALSCAPPAPPESKSDKLATSLCGCTTQLLALNQKAQTEADSLAFRNIAAAFEKARECASRLGIKPEDRSALELALGLKCPTLAANKELLIELLGY